MGQRTRLAIRAATTLVGVIVCAGCGGTPTPVSPSPSTTPIPAPAPTPSPPPSRFAFAGHVVETLTRVPIAGAIITAGGASISTDSTGAFSFDGTNTSTPIAVSAPGYLTHETTIRAGQDTTVDLIHDAAPFSLVFYREMARNTWEGTTADVLRVLQAAPAFYMQTTGLTVENVNRLRLAARSIVPAFTGSRFGVTTFETGSEARPEQSGWIVIELVNQPDETNWCGRAYVGALSGHIWLNTADRCLADHGEVNDAVLSHEIGHALGFWHLDFPNALMYPSYQTSHKAITDGERYHGSIAYTRFAGNADVDVDANGIGPRRLPMDRVLMSD